VVQFIADLGDNETKVRASKKLVEVAEYTASPKWRDERAPQVRKANQDSKLNPTPAQFDKQLAEYQEEELVRLFASMKKIGCKPVVDYLIAFASQKSASEKIRSAALAALENNLDKNDNQHIEAMIALAKANDTPDPVRDLALRRIGEMPRKNVINRLFGLFDHPNWKVRWVAAELVLKMTDSTQLPEFMTKLGEAKTMALAEPLRYGELLADIKGPQRPEAFVPGYAEPRNKVPVRLTALSWYFHDGTAKDLPLVKQWERDKAAVPKCAPDAKDCEWKCENPTPDGKSEAHEIATVGEFVLYCVIPEIDRRTASQKK
jgi:HEAT repeat protein